MIKVKVCGITSKEDAYAALDCGADALGFVFYPGSPRAVTPETARKIVSSLPPFVSYVGVFVDNEKQELEEISSYAGLTTVQLHGSETPDYCELSKKTIKAFRIKGIKDIKHLKEYSAASAYLLDTYSPDLLGGTGKVFKWDIAVEAKKYGRIILAGGLNPDNIEEAVRVVQPYGVDVSTGVEGEEKGKKDLSKLKLFIESAKNVHIP